MRDIKEAMDELTSKKGLLFTLAFKRENIKIEEIAKRLREAFKDIDFEVWIPDTNYEKD